MDLEIKYSGSETVNLNIPKKLESSVRFLNINDSVPSITKKDIVSRLRPIVKSPKTSDMILVAVSDITRKTGFSQFFPLLLGEWEKKGVKRENISFIFATGVHRAPTDSEMEQILGKDIYMAFKGRILINNASQDSDYRFYGTTNLNTPVFLNKALDKFDKFFITGTVKFHYFAGFGGGRKTIVPGVASSQTVAKNHSLSIDYENYSFSKGVDIGSVAENPVARDMQEAAGMARIDGAVNTIISSDGRIIDLFAGDHDDVFNKGINKAKEVYSVKIEKKADIVLAVGSGYRNLLQTHKVLYNAHRVIRQGGYKIIASPCYDGIGSDSYRKWIEIKNIKSLVDTLRIEPDINGQTALSTLLKAKNTFILTELPDRTVELFSMKKTPSIQDTMDSIIKKLENQGIDKPLIYVMPQAGETIAFMEKGDLHEK